jgi:hypothetical protein
MDFFHIVYDTCLLRETPFGSPAFERLLRRVQQGVAKIYIPYIALEERRTQLVDDYVELMVPIETNIGNMGRGQMSWILQGLAAPEAFLPKRAEVDNNSYSVLGKYLADNKVEVLPYTMDHAHGAWKRYFGVEAPFRASEKRANRRKDIPDSWILEATLELKGRTGRHCMLTKDGKLEGALKDAGFEVWKNVVELDEEIGRTTTVSPIGATVRPASAASVDHLRSAAFENVALIVLGINEALDAPDKETLFGQLEFAGVNRAIAEHEAITLVLSGVLKDTGNHFIPTDKAQAELALAQPLVQECLLRVVG